MEEIIKEERKPQKNKIKLGILWCGYNCADSILKNLNNWFSRVECKTDFIFSCVSTPFENYGIEDNSETVKLLNFLLDNKFIQYLNIFDKPMTESAARNSALQPLLKENCDYILILDSDEVYQQKDIHNLLYVLNNEENSLYSTFRIEFKNLVFDNNHYVKNFSPMRIWKRDLGRYILHEVIGDNDCFYKEKNTNIIVSDKNFSNKLISTELINPLHESWNSYDRSCKKIKYQIARGWQCSYRINEEKKCIELNDEYFKSKNEPIPEIFSL